MKVTVHSKEVESKYPYVGIRNSKEEHHVILFHGCCRGICIDSSDQRDVGRYSEYWTEEDFTKCSVTIE
jgi:hypothetical protein